MLINKEQLNMLNEQLDIECRKTANYLMFALENDRRFLSNVQYENKKIMISCLIWTENSEKYDDHGWNFPYVKKDPNAITAICKKIAELIAFYTENRFRAVAKTQGTYQLMLTDIGESIIQDSITDRAEIWKKRFAKNADVNDWCVKRIFKDGFPPKITVRKNGIVVEKTAVVYDDEDYDDLQSKEEIYGMALCIAEHGMGKYILKLFEDADGSGIEMNFFEPRKRKTW